MQLIITNSPVGNRGNLSTHQEALPQKHTATEVGIDRAAVHSFGAATKSGPYVIRKWVAVLVRRGDYEAHCKWLGHLKSPWNIAKMLPFQRLLRLLSPAQEGCLEFLVAEARTRYWPSVAFPLVSPENNNQTLMALFFFNPLRLRTVRS